jgi:hypothetical protein
MYREIFTERDFRYFGDGRYLLVAPLEHCFLHSDLKKKNDKILFKKSIKNKYKKFLKYFIS